EIDEVLRGIHTASRTAFEAKLFCALRSYGKNDGGRIEIAQVLDREAAIFGHADVPEIMYVGQCQNFGELLSQSHLHFVLRRINTVFGQAAGFDIAIEDDNMVAGKRDLLRGEHSRRPRAYDEHRLHAWSFSSALNSASVSYSRR